MTIMLMTIMLMTIMLMTIILMTIIAGNHIGRIPRTIRSLPGSSSRYASNNLVESLRRLSEAGFPDTQVQRTSKVRCT